MSTNTKSLQNGISDGEDAANIAIITAFASVESIKDQRQYVGWWAGFVTTIAGAMNQAVGPEQAQVILNSCINFSKGDGPT